MKPTLKPTGIKRLKLKCDILLSTSAFKFNLRRYIKEAITDDASALVACLGESPLAERHTTPSDTWIGRMGGDRAALLRFVEPKVRAAAAGRTAGVVECMRLNLVLGSFVTVWQCLADLVHDELKHAVGGTAAQLAWQRLSRDFFPGSGGAGGGGGSTRGAAAVHRSKPALLSEFRLRVATHAMGLVASVAGRGLQSSTSQLSVRTFCGIRWVLSVDRWVITRHKLDTKRLTD
jgi:hypothetical protein